MNDKGRVKQSIIPSIESRGVHNMVVFNPFSVPEKELLRDKNGFLEVRRKIW